MPRRTDSRDNLTYHERTTPRTAALWQVLGVLVVLLAAPSIEAKESKAPYIESLQVTQLRAARASAPQGQDEPLSIPGQPLALPPDPASPVVVEEQGRSADRGREVGAV